MFRWRAHNLCERILQKSSKSTQHISCKPDYFLWFLPANSDHNAQAVVAVIVLMLTSNQELSCPWKHKMQSLKYIINFALKVSSHSVRGLSFCVFRRVQRVWKKRVTSHGQRNCNPLAPPPSGWSASNSKFPLLFLNNHWVISLVFPSTTSSALCADADVLVPLRTSI